MVDPYAPPQETPNRPIRPAPYTEPYQPSGQVYQQTYEAAPTHETARDRPWRRSEAHEPHTEPAKLGLFWTVAAVGIGLLCLARLMLFFVVQDNLPNDQVASALFATLGIIALSLGLCLAGLLQRGLATPWRIALMIGAGFFAVSGGFPLGGFGGLF
ncbi:MAG: hypothetical protein QOJ26_640 [Thermoplasmata archaeon]|jgi:hypothetical protein|nr:hypothetical protein [Thermoplasmata archaeon]MEA3165774.1 hypothetical protein [Thermoplasmata archaeon]